MMIGYFRIEMMLMVLSFILIGGCLECDNVEDNKTNAEDGNEG